MALPPQPPVGPAPIPFPVTVYAAGGVWIAFGLLLMMAPLLTLAAPTQRVDDAAIGIAWAGAMLGGWIVGLGCLPVGCCASVIVPVVVGGAFVAIGSKTIWGTVPDTQANGVGSIGIAGVLGALGISVGAGVLWWLAMVVPPLASGVLALVGREGYCAWKAQARPPVGGGPRPTADGGM